MRKVDDGARTEEANALTIFHLERERLNPEYNQASAAIKTLRNIVVNGKDQDLSLSTKYGIMYPTTESQSRYNTLEKLETALEVKDRVWRYIIPELLKVSEYPYDRVSEMKRFWSAATGVGGDVRDTAALKVAREVRRTFSEEPVEFWRKALGIQNSVNKEQADNESWQKQHVAKVSKFFEMLPLVAIHTGFGPHSAEKTNLEPSNFNLEQAQLLALPFHEPQDVLGMLRNMHQGVGKILSRPMQYRAAISRQGVTTKDIAGYQESTKAGLSALINERFRVATRRMGEGDAHARYENGCVALAEDLRGFSEFFTRVMLAIVRVDAGLEDADGYFSEVRELARRLRQTAPDAKQLTLELPPNSDVEMKTREKADSIQMWAKETAAQLLLLELLLGKVVEKIEAGAHCDSNSSRKCDVYAARAAESARKILRAAADALDDALTADPTGDSDGAEKQSHDVNLSNENPLGSDQDRDQDQDRHLILLEIHRQERREEHENRVSEYTDSFRDGPQRYGVPKREGAGVEALTDQKLFARVGRLLFKRNQVYKAVREADRRVQEQQRMRMLEANWLRLHVVEHKLLEYRDQRQEWEKKLAEEREQREKAEREVERLRSQLNAVNFNQGRAENGSGFMLRGVQAAVGDGNGGSTKRSLSV